MTRSALEQQCPDTLPRDAQLVAAPAVPNQLDLTELSPLPHSGRPTMLISKSLI